MKCDRSLHGQSLIQHDANEDVIDYALARAGLGLLLDERQRWTIGDAELSVSKWWVESTRLFALRIWDGWPRPGRGWTVPRSLDPAMIYAAAVSGELFKPTFAEHGKWKLRVLLDGGVVNSLLRATPPLLPDDATRSEALVWQAVWELLAVDRACGCRSPGTPLMATPRFIARWSGDTVHVARDGLRRLRMRDYLKPSATAPTSGSSPRTALLYRVYGDE